MKKLFFIFSLSYFFQVFAQNESFEHNEFQISKQEYNKISTFSNNFLIIDRAITIEKDEITKFSKNTTEIIKPKDWLSLLYVHEYATKKDTFENSTLNFTKKVYDLILNQSALNDRFNIPIGVINYKALSVKEESYTNGKLFYNNGWEVSNNTNIFDTLDFSLGSILYDGIIEESELRIYFDTSLVISKKPILFIKLKINDIDYELTPNSYVDITLTNNDTIITFETHFTDEIIINQNKLNISIENNISTRNDVFTGGKHIYYSPSPTTFANYMRFGIIWGKCNTSEKILRPVIMLHGYRPPIQPIFPSLDKLYNKKFNFKGSSNPGAGFVDLLVQNGYDVIICRIDPGFGSIQSGGDLIASFIENYIEPSKSSNNSKYESIVLGFSMGAQYLRYALMKMEKEHLFDNKPNHHVRMWIPFDSPNEGANIPLAHQWAAWSMAEHTAGAPTFNIAYNGLNTAGSREQMRYHYGGIPGNDGAFHRFHEARTNFLSKLNNDFYIGSNLIKYRGYPSSTRNVGVSVGSNSDDDYQGLTSGDLTWSDNSLVTGPFSFKAWNVKLYAEKYASTSSNNPFLLFKRYITRYVYLTGNTNVLVNDVVKNYNLLEMDNCFGSYHNKIRETINDGLDWNSLLGFNDYDYEGNQVFVPTVSALAINPSHWPVNMRYDLKVNGLLFNSFNLNPQTGISNHFGYPHLGRPNDYQSLTPLDAIYCNDLTYEHITLIDDENNQNDQSELLSFLLNEIEPWYLDLQNIEFGKYARADYTYNAKYFAKEWIRTGKDLSPKSPFGEFKVLHNADVELQSEKLIELKPGTHIMAGADFRAHISSWPSCSGRGTSANTESSNQMENEAAHYFTNSFSNSVDQAVFLFPNPTNSMFSIKGIEPQKEENYLEIYNSQGLLTEKLVLDNFENISLAQQYVPNSLLFVKVIDQEGKTHILKLNIK